MRASTPSSHATVPTPAVADAAAVDAIAVAIGDPPLPTLVALVALVALEALPPRVSTVIAGVTTTRNGGAPPRGPAVSVAMVAPE